MNMYCFFGGAGVVESQLLYRINKQDIMCS